MKRSLLTVRIQEKCQECCLNDLKPWELHCHFLRWKTFRVASVMNKQNNHIVSFVQYISDACYMSTTNQLASVMMVGVM